MANFFSSIKGKFTAGFEGRYLGNIIEHIAEVRPEVVRPLIKLSGLSQRGSEKPTVTSEYSFRDSARRADLCIKWGTNSTATLLVEIKTGDNFEDKEDGKNTQLKDYAKEAEDEEAEGRAVAVIALTASPIPSGAEKLIAESKGRLKHLYLSEYAKEIDSLAAHKEKSELLTWFYKYLKEEGYAMYNLMEKENKGEDYKALLYFMKQNFLPHSGKVSARSEQQEGGKTSEDNIKRSISIFNALLQNWQLVSQRLAPGLLKKRSVPIQRQSPTIRYFTEQGYGAQKIGEKKITLKKIAQKITDGFGDVPTLSKAKVEKIAREIAKEVDEKIAKEFDDRVCDKNRTLHEVCENKKWGKYHFTADITVGKIGNTTLYLEWGQVISIQKGNSDIGCIVYAAFSLKNIISLSQTSMKEGIRDCALYTPEEFMKTVNRCIKEAAKKGAKDPELKKLLAPYAL